MATIEDVKAKLIAVRAAIPVQTEIVAASGVATVDGAPTAPTAPDPFAAALDDAIAALATLPDPDVLAMQLAQSMDHRAGARVRAKLDAAQGIMAKLTAAQAAVWPEGNTHRDGFVRGLEEAHKHVQSLGDVDVDDGG